MNITDRLLLLEEKVAKNKSDLNSLLSEYDRENSQQGVQKRIEELEHEIHYIHAQLEELKRQPAVNCVYDVKPETPAVVDKVPDMTAVIDKIPETPAVIDKVPDTPQQHEIKHRDLESVFGKSLMGVFASVLIFISLVFFATLLIPKMTDTIKLILMYIFSFSFAGFGIYKLNKDPGNKLFISLASCGMGSIYISLFMTKLYFHVINDITLYVLLLVWAVGICFLSRFHSVIFQIIGQCGIVIAVLFGRIYCETSGDTQMILFLTIFLVLTELIYWFYYKHLAYANLYINNIGAYISTSIIMQYSTMAWSQITHLMTDDKSTIFLICRIALACLILMDICIVLVKHNDAIKYNAFWGNLSIVANVWFLCSILSGAHIVLMGIVLLVLVLVEYVNRSRENRFFFSQCACAIVFLRMLYSCNLLEAVVELSSISIPCIIALLYGYIRDKKEYRIIGLAYLIVFIVYGNMDFVMYFVLGILICGLTVFIAKSRGMCDKKLRNILYMVSLYFIFANILNILHEIDYYDALRMFTENMHFIVAFYFIYNAVVRFYKKDLVSTKITTSVNSIIMLITIIWLGNSNLLYEDVLTHLILILVAVASFAVNSKNLLEKESDFWGYYVGFKFTILIWIILESFDAPTLVISIACLLLAICAIIIGFAFKYKSTRVYGLILCLVSIIKLMLVDITYSNTVGRAFSFFICGILCFVVSAIYNRVDKHKS